MGAVATQWHSPQCIFEDALDGGEVGKIDIHGVNFTRDGKPWKYRAITAFRAPDLFMSNRLAELEAYLVWAAMLGVNTIRVFATWENTKFGPKFVQNYYERMKLFLQYAASWGFYVHLVGLCDMKPGNQVYLSFEEQWHHLDKLAQMSREVGNVFFEVSNEDTDPDSGGTAKLFPADLFSGVLSTRSTWAGDENPQAAGTYLDWVTVHLPRSDDFAAKGKVLYESQRQGLGQYPASGRPSISGEPRRIAEGTSAAQHADNALVCELMGSGGLIHGGFSSLDPGHQSDLQNCRIPSGLALECCVAVSETWDAAGELIHPEAASRGRYTRGGFSDCPIEHDDNLALRSYFMEVDGRMYGGAIDRKPGWVLKPVNGWRVVEQGGYHGNIIVLER